MPAYNCGKYISQSIRSVLNQTYKEFEFIIIDDGSTDNTEEIVRTFKDERILYKKNNHKGTSGALNYGISFASGDWIARIDADDLNFPDRLEKQMNFIDNNSQYDILSSWSVYFNNKGKICYFWKSPVSNEEIHMSLNRYNPLNQSGLMIKKKLFSEYKFNESFLYFEDYELMFKVRDKVKFCNIPEYLVYTRIRKDSKSFTSNSDNIFKMLFNASNNKLNISESSHESKYWNGICGDICLFYGNVKDAYKYFWKSFKIKNYLKIIMIAIFGGNVKKLLKKNIQLRVMSLFRYKSKYNKFLEKYIN